jgi:hypothetical protein
LEFSILSDTNFESVLPPDALELAEAIATRNVWEAEISSKITAGLQGEVYVPASQEILRDMYIGRTAFNLARISAPEMVVSTADAIDTISSKQYEKIAKEASRHIDDEEFIVTPKSVRGVAHTFTTELQSSSGLTDEGIAKLFARTLKSAREVARERGVTVASVYIDDDLYFEAERREFALEEAAELFATFVEAFSGKVFAKAFSSELGSLVPQSELDELTPDELEELKQEFVTDPEVIRQYTELAELQKETFRQTFTFVLAKIYGLDSLQSLSSKLRLAIMPRRPLVKEVFDTL